MLSDIKIRALRPRDRLYKVSDGEGLYIQVAPNGTKSWRMGYRFGGKQKSLTFGTYPKVTLKEARVRRDAAREAVAQGRDPLVEKRAGKRPAAETENSFRAVADRWFKLNSPRWVPSYSVRLRARLVDDVYPQIGAQPVDAISPQDVLAVIRKVEARGAVEMGKRINQMISSVFKFAVAEGIAERDPARDITAALAPRRPVKHRTAIRGDEMPALMKRIDDYEGDVITMGALKLIAHTFVRTNELRQAQWREFEGLDGPEPLWRIPAAKMKMRREHLVPLSHQAAAILLRVRRITGHGDLVFPSPVHGKAQPISENTLIYAIYRLGYRSRATVHGFRATASTLLNEREFNRDWIELQLAHVDASVRGVYNAALWLRQRREMMQWWSDHIESQGLFDDILG